MADPLSPIFGVKKPKCLIAYHTENNALESVFPKQTTNSKSVEPLSRNGNQNMAKNGHVYVIFCRPEAAGKVICGWGGCNVPTDHKVLRGAKFRICKLQYVVFEKTKSDI